MIRFITEHKDLRVPRAGVAGPGLRWGVEPMCTVLTEHGIKISAATYYEWVNAKPTRRQLRDVEVLALLTAERSHPKTGKLAATLGSRKMWIRLRSKGHDVARCTVERLMRAQGWEGARYGSKPRTTTANEEHSRAPDLVDRDFNPLAPNRLWVADFTYVPTWTGTVYVAFVIDAYARRIIGWRAARSMTTPLVLDALEHAFFTRAREGVTDLAGLIAHNDAGSQGEFNWSSQHLDHGGVWWRVRGSRGRSDRRARGGSGPRTGRCGRRCGRRAVRSRRGLCSVTSGV